MSFFCDAETGSGLTLIQWAYAPSRPSLLWPGQTGFVCVTCGLCPEPSPLSSLRPVSARGAVYGEGGWGIADLIHHSSAFRDVQVQVQSRGVFGRIDTRGSARVPGILSSLKGDALRVDDLL